MTQADTQPTRYLGKYRGTVVDDIDPMQLGRVQVLVPDVTGAASTSWAMPCVPVAGINSGVFTIPPIGSGVWVEFEQGALDRPIWVGGYWATPADVPTMARATPPGVFGITLQTTLNNGITISDAPGPAGGILVQATTGATISVSDAGIVISNGKGATMTLTGPTVDINGGALTVT